MRDWVYHRRRREDRAVILDYVQTIVLRTPAAKEVNEIMETYAEYLIKKGMQEGEQKGQDRGRIEELRRQILRRGLRNIGPATGFEEILNTIVDINRLDDMLDRAGEVGSWADLLSEGSTQ